MKAVGGPSRPENPAPPATGPQPWTTGLAPRYIALFLLIVFFDRLGPATLQVGGLAPSLLGAVVGSGLCFLLLYYAPALWGWSARRSFSEVASHTFGKTGSRWLVTSVLILSQTIWFAVAIAYADLLTCRALALAGLAAPSSCEVPNGFLFQATALLWIPPAVLLGPLLVHLVAAVLSVYVIFPTLIFGGLLLWSLRGLPGASWPPAGPWDKWQAFAAMVQLILGYFATAGAGASEWGAVSRDRRDLAVGGLVGVMTAPIVVVSMALVTVAGHLGRNPTINDATYVAVLSQGIGGRLGCALTMAFALSLLGPACYMPANVVRSGTAAWPMTSRWFWSILVGVLAWPLVASGFALRLETVFGVLGALVAPLIAAVTADCIREKGHWPGPRPGCRYFSLLSWGLGCSLGLLPYLGLTSASYLQPSILLGYTVSFVTQFTLGFLASSQTGLDLRARHATEPGRCSSRSSPTE